MFGKTKRHSDVIAVFDISSSSVGGTHALIHREQEKPASATLLASVRAEGTLQEDINMKRFVSDTVHNIEHVATSLSKADLHKPSHVEIVLASPWYISQTRLVSFSQETPFVCTKKFIQKLVDDEIAHVIKNELERFGTYGKEGTVVEKQISLVRLNGYATGDPFGKKARTIELSLTLTIVPKKIIDEFTDTLRRTYGTRPIHITTSPYATFVVARDYFNKGKECVIIDVGEEVTDIGFVKNELFLYQHSFPVGTYGLYRALLGNAGQRLVEAKALVEGYRLEKISATAKGKVEKALHAFSQQWQESLQSAFGEGYYGFCLPETCFIIADPRFEGVFPTLIATDPFIQHTCSRGVVTPLFINETMLSPFVTSIDATIDVALATGVLFTARMI